MDQELRHGQSETLFLVQEPKPGQGETLFLTWRKKSETLHGIELRFSGRLSPDRMRELERKHRDAAVEFAAAEVELTAWIRAVDKERECA